MTATLRFPETGAEIADIADFIIETFDCLDVLAHALGKDLSGLKRQYAVICLRQHAINEIEQFSFGSMRAVESAIRAGGEERARHEVCTVQLAWTDGK